MEPASRFKRFVAHIIDIIISGIVMFIAMFGYALVLLFGNYLADPEKIDTDPIYLIPATIIGLLLAMVYYALFESSKYRATPGKMIFKMHVSTNESHKLTFVQSSYRYLCLMCITILYNVSEMGDFLPLAKSTVYIVTAILGGCFMLFRSTLQRKERAYMRY